MTNPRELLLTVLHQDDASKSRSLQTQIGPSEIGGCRRKVWYKLNEQPQTNFNLKKLAAIMGTAIHNKIEEAILKIDPNSEQYLVESEVEYDGLKAHIDLFVPETGDVIDWKTVKVKNLGYFPSTQQRWQVQVYGYLIEKSGKGKVNRVHLVAIARDGDEDDVKVHSEPYDESIALTALNWLKLVREATEAPAPEKDESFCKHYCEYYDSSGEMGCVGLKKERGVTTDVVIPDPEVDSNALLWLQFDAKIKELEKQKDSLKASFEGLLGVTNSGIEISWSTISGRSSVDSDEVEKLLGFIPKKIGLETQRLSVKASGGN